MKMKKLVAVMLCMVLALGSFGCARGEKEYAKNAGEDLKYVFFFIGDGMSYPQFQLASDYLGAMADADYMGALPSLAYENRTATLDGPVELNFMGFEEVGTAVTFDSCSFAPDSAAAGTAIASG